MIKTKFAVAIAAISIISTTALRGVTIGQIDTFETGTAGWHVGDPTHPAPPVTSGGGPGGIADRFLSLQSLGGFGPGSRLAVLSGPQWAGDYIAAGITSIVMDVNNFGPEDVNLRLLFEDLPPAGPPNHLALSADSIFLPAGGGWTTISFSITPDALISGGFGTVEGALANTDVWRLFHNPAASFPGPGVGIPVISVQLGVDNIRAVASVPESPVAGVSLLWLGLGAIAALRRKRA